MQALCDELLHKACSCITERLVLAILIFFSFHNTIMLTLRFLATVLYGVGVAT